MDKRTLAPEIRALMIVGGLVLGLCIAYLCDPTAGVRDVDGRQPHVDELASKRAKSATPSSAPDKPADSGAPASVTDAPATA